jgi:protein-S-isoprenylcysteine O-methyltransferase Ste14
MTSTLGVGALSDEMQDVLAIAVIVVGSLLVLYLFARSRSENRLMVESLNNEYDD